MTTINPLTYLQLATQYGPKIGALITELTSNDDLATKIKLEAGPLADILTGIGATLFPDAAPELQLIGAAIAAFNPSSTKTLQGLLNALVKPSPNLVVDGIYGAKTTAAIKQLQTQLGITPDGIAANLTQKALMAFLAKVPTL